MPEKSRRRRHEPDDVVFEAGHYLQQSSRTLLHSLGAELGSERDRQRFVDLLERLQSYYGLLLRERFEALRTIFIELVPETMEQPEAQISHDFVTPEEWESLVCTKDDYFLDQLHQGLCMANFEILSKEDHEIATKIEFECPLEQDFDHSLLQTDMLERFHERHQHDASIRAASDITKSVLVYKRGFCQAKCSGFFPMEKIDLMLELIIESLMYLPNLLFFGLFLRKRGNEDADSAVNDVNEIGGATEHVEDDIERDSNADFDSDEDENARTRVRVLKRRTLRQAILQRPSRLFTTVELFEPAYREVITIHRTASEAKSAGKTRRLPQMDVRCFNEVPMADYEIILPAQRPVTRAFDILKLILAVFAAVVYVMQQLNSQLEIEDDRDAVDIIVDLWQVLLGLAMYLSKVIVKWLNARAIYQRMITSYLYKKTFATKRAVCVFIKEQIYKQEFLEAAIAYFFLWRHDVPTVQALDSEIEHFLTVNGEDADFEVDDALQKLRRDELVKYDDVYQYDGHLLPSTELQYMPIARAIRKLDELRDGFLRRPNRVCPYCTWNICAPEVDTASSLSQELTQLVLKLAVLGKPFEYLDDVDGKSLQKSAKLARRYADSAKDLTEAAVAAERATTVWICAECSAEMPGTSVRCQDCGAPRGKNTKYGNSRRAAAVKKSNSAFKVAVKAVDTAMHARARLQAKILKLMDTGTA